MHDELQKIQLIQVHLNAESERFKRSEMLLHDLMEAGCVSPVLFVTKGIEAKNALALGKRG